MGQSLKNNKIKSENDLLILKTNLKLLANYSLFFGMPFWSGLGIRVQKVYFNNSYIFLVFFSANLRKHYW